MNPAIDEDALSYKDAFLAFLKTILMLLVVLAFALWLLWCLLGCLVMLSLVCLVVLVFGWLFGCGFGGCVFFSHIQTHN